MSDGGADRARVEALLQANAELAAEIRSLALGRIDSPRSSGSPAVRRLAALLAERDSLTAERDTLGSELDDARSQLRAARDRSEELSAQIDQLNAQIQEQALYIEQLRTGFAGLLRRARRRLLRA